MKKAAFMLVWVPLLVPLCAHAAAVRLIASTTAVVGQPFSVGVALDAQGDDVNTIQATISYPASFFSLQGVNDGDSIVNFWIVSPNATSPGVIELAGIVPGGFNGSSGPITSLVFDPIATGIATLDVATATAFRNDGMGSSIPVTLSGIAAIIAVPASGTSPVPPANSLIVPNSFTPHITSDPSIFDGKYFMVFNTTDKGSGIDHYEVLEVSTGVGAESASAWVVARSPYVLQDQGLSSDVYVRAVDHAGNFIVVEVPARFPNIIPRSVFVALAVARAIVIAVVVLFLIWFVRRKRKSS